jgi:hypothetical protein
MPGPDEAAITLAAALEKALDQKSSSYLDVRELQQKKITPGRGLFVSLH